MVKIWVVASGGISVEIDKKRKVTDRGVSGQLEQRRDFGFELGDWLLVERKYK